MEPTLLDQFMLHAPELALAGALAWGAGIRLYLVVFLFGLASWLGYWPLPEHLAVQEQRYGELRAARDPVRARRSFARLKVVEGGHMPPVTRAELTASFIAQAAHARRTAA